MSARWRDVKPCGTTAAYRRHARRGEPIDEACRQANIRATQDVRARRKAAGTLPKGQ
jgi:hypothetical protein